MKFNLSLLFFILFTIVVNIDTPFIPSYNLIKTNNKLAIDLPDLWKILMIFFFFWNSTFYHLKLCNRLYFAPDYTLHSKLFEHILCTLNYHIHHTLHPGVIFVVMFNKILLLVISICFLLRWNRLKKPKNSSSKSIKQNPKHPFRNVENILHQK